MLETLQQLDQQLLLTLNGLHSPYWDSFMWLFTGRFIWIPMYATILYILCKNFNVYVTLLTAVAIALTITYADQLCATWIRPAVERLRPSNLNNPLSEFVHIVNGKRGGSYGFPSCHASNSFGLAFFLLFFFRQRWLSIFILCWDVTSCYTRVKDVPVTPLKPVSVTYGYLSVFNNLKWEPVAYAGPREGRFLF